MQNEVHILGLETSCDDTCAAVVRNGIDVLSSIVSSQHEFHRPYGGVVPEVAARQHTRIIASVIEEATQTAGMSWSTLSGIAVTTEPGLIGSLLVGVGAAKGIALGQGLPLLPVNHLHAHVQSLFMTEPSISGPYVCLVVSGGHTLLLYVVKPGDARVMGSTLDDAAGEAIDKGAHLLGLGYPGGPELDRLASTGDPEAIAFPRPVERRPGFDFSFSGLKTALAVYLRNHGRPRTQQSLGDLCASYLEAIVDVLVKKTLAAARIAGINTVGITGGVASNSRLRTVIQQACVFEGFDVILPPLELCTDNAAMVASLGHAFLLGDHVGDLSVDARARTKLPRWENSGA
jgi:N6-L-threonylcarbamoyladenine synthase